MSSSSSSSVRGGGAGSPEGSDPSPRCTPGLPADEAPRGGADEGVLDELLLCLVGKAPAPAPEAAAAAPPPRAWRDFAPLPAVIEDWRAARESLEAEVPPYKYIQSCRAPRTSGRDDDGDGGGTCACVPDGAGAGGGEECVGVRCVNRYAYGGGSGSGGGPVCVCVCVHA